MTDFVDAKTSFAFCTVLDKGCFGVVLKTEQMQIQDFSLEWQWQIQDFLEGERQLLSGVLT